MGSDLEKRSASRRLSQEMCSSTRDEGAADGTAAGGGYPAMIGQPIDLQSNAL